jgi:hypothetical protein
MTLRRDTRNPLLLDARRLTTRATHVMADITSARSTLRAPSQLPTPAFVTRRARAPATSADALGASSTCWLPCCTAFPVQPSETGTAKAVHLLAAVTGLLIVGLLLIDVFCTVFVERRGPGPVSRLVYSDG